MNVPTLQQGRVRLAEVLAGPRYPDHPYVLSGSTHGQVYAMAAWLVEHFRTSGGERQLVCLAAEDRSIIAAAVLASLAGGPILLLPYGFSERILAGIHGSTGYRSAIVDRDLPWPPGVETVHPQPQANQPLVADPAPTADRVLLHLYTGGSTGVPQFWSKTAGNLLFETMHLVDFLVVTPEDRIVATVSPYHIYGLLYSVLLPLLASAAVSPLTPSYPAEIVEAVAAEQATILVSVPAHYDALHGRTCATSWLRLAT
ncbi:MAG: AMP-binding protein, partial [Desulfofustis sp.]|nr:AMP-binding protein [Desulfofustis sp.]